MIIKRLLKKHKYPPEGMEDAVHTVMNQCELWADNEEFSDVDYSENSNVVYYDFGKDEGYAMAAESSEIKS